jgi:hypothetical protein
MTAASSLVASLALASVAGAEVHVVFGTSWDGPANTLQKIVDNRYGAGHINVETDYIGAHPGDIDPWFWFGDHFDAMMIREVSANASRNVLCWYEEDGTRPAYPGGGVVFEGRASQGATAVVVFSHPRMHFGFMMEPNAAPGALSAPNAELFFTNRMYNDPGPPGATHAIHEPYDGDVQALVFDVSPWTAPNTWLVCFEDLDTGSMPGPPGVAACDNDFNDMVFEVQALGATPVAGLSFGTLKAMYRR